jgi:hypothetical protein
MVGKSGLFIPQDPRCPGSWRRSIVFLCYSTVFKVFWIGLQPMKSTSASLSSVKTHQENQQLKNRIGKLEQQIESLEKQLTSARASKIRLSLNGKRPAKDSDTFCRVIIPDSHGCYIDEDAAAAMIADLAIIRPASVIMLGDHLDCGGFLAEHHTMGFVAEAAYTFENDCDAANQFFDAIQKAAPDATIDYLEGNHERRIEKACVTTAVRKHIDSAFLANYFSTKIVLHLEKRGIEFWPQGKFHEGLRIPATIRRDGCYFTHGEFTSKNAAAQHLAKYNANIWYAHTHRADMATKRTVKDGAIGAWNPGCLCRLQPLWMHTNLTDWTHGYGLQVVRRGIGHLNLQIPIIDGVSYLAPLVDMGSRKLRGAR